MTLSKKPFVFVCLFLPQWALAWGFIAHRATGFIADTRLNPETATAVHKILGATPMAEAATWADSLRDDPQYNDMKKYHFMNIPLSMSDQKSPKAQDVLSSPEHQPGAYEAILKAKKTLVDNQSNQKDTEEALKFLIHFIGDIHQPLHVGYQKDYGGNTVKLTWSGYDTNLHSVWDTMIIKQANKDLFDHPGTTDASQIYAQNVAKRHANDSVNLGNLDTWFQDSLNLVNVAYQGDPTNPDDYTKRNQDVIDQQVYLAGLRIADTLNQIFSKDGKARFDQYLAQDKIKYMFSAIDRMVQLGPQP
jgi:hypothetical protein